MAGLPLSHRKRPIRPFRLHEEVGHGGEMGMTRRDDVAAEVLADVWMDQLGLRAVVVVRFGLYDTTRDRFGISK